MLTKIIIFAIILLALLAVYFIFKPKDNALHRNMRPQTGKIIRIIVFIGILVCLIFIITNSYEYTLSDNPGLFTEKIDSDKTSAPIQKVSKGEVLVSICEDVVTINKQSFRYGSSVSDIEDTLFEYISKGKTVRLIDNYALSSAYEGVIDILSDMGVKRENIVEITEP